jgi:hypothetical protein
MPEICRFFGISIKMYFGDHRPPHFHAEYGEHSAVIDIQTLIVINGYVPPRVLGMIVEWAAQHRTDLIDLWELAANHQALHRLPPLE